MGTGNQPEQTGQRKYEVSGRVPVDSLIPANDPREAAQLWMLENEGYLPETVGSRAVIGTDEGDGTVILDGDKYHTENDGEDPLFFLDERVNGLGEDDLEVFAEGEDEDADEDADEDE